MENNENMGYTNYMQNIKWYNPNKFNPLDSAFTYLIFLVSFFILPYGFNYIIRLFISYGLKDMYIILSLSILFSQGLIFGIVMIYSKMSNVNPYIGGGYRPQLKSVPALMSVILIMGMLVIFSPVTENFVESIYSLGGAFNDYNLEGNAFVALIYALVLTTVLPAICEELLFRGIILKGLLPYGKTFAIVMSSLMFALAHGSFSQFLYQFLVGLAIGTVVVMSKDIKIGMIMHFTNNLFATIYAIILQNSPNIKINAGYVTVALSIVIGTICLIAASIYFIKFGLNQYKKEILNEKTDSNLKSCLSYEKNFDATTLINYDESIRYSTNEVKIYFYDNKKGFIAMRNAVKSVLPKILLFLGLLLACLLILNDYFAII